MVGANTADAQGDDRGTDGYAGSQRLPVSEAEIGAYEVRHEALLSAIDRLEAALADLEAQSELDGSRFASIAHQFLGDLQQHVDESEAPDGLLAQVCESAPWFAARAGQLRDDHIDLLEQAGRLVHAAADRQDPGELLDDARRLAAVASAHRHRGTEPLLDAFLRDVGAAD